MVADKELEIDALRRGLEAIGGSSYPTPPCRTQTSDYEQVRWMTPGAPFRRVVLRFAALTGRALDGRDWMPHSRRRTLMLVQAVRQAEAKAAGARAGGFALACWGICISMMT